MREQIVDFETAKLAWDKGFKEKTVKGYYKHGDVMLILWVDSENYNDQEDFVCPAPTQSFLQKWLREEYNTHVWASCTPYLNSFTFNYNLNKGIFVDSIKYSSYEKALEEGLKEVLKTIIND